MSALTWEERVELAQCYAPRLILFPEQQELGRPKIEGGAGDYHPRSLELLLERGRLYPGTLRALGRLKFAWLFSHASRTPATLHLHRCARLTRQPQQVVGASALLFSPLAQGFL